MYSLSPYLPQFQPEGNFEVDLHVYLGSISRDVQ